MRQPRTGTPARRRALSVGAIVMVTLVGLGLLISPRLASPALTPSHVPAAGGTGAVAGVGGTASRSATARNANPRGPLARAAMTPATFVDAGFATPDAAIVTFIWALSQGHVDVASRALALDAHGRATIDAFLSRLPPDVAGRYRPPERFIALLWAGEWADAGDLAGVKVLNVRRTDNSASVRLECRFVGGRVYRFRLNLAPSAAGWQTQVESSLVDGFISNHFLEPQTVSLR